MSNPTLNLNLNDVAKSIARLIQLKGATRLQVSFWDAQHELVSSETNMPVSQPAGPRVLTLALKAPTAAYAITEAYDRDGRFIDGDTLTVAR